MIRLQFFDKKLMQEGHITRSKDLTILVDYQAKMEVVLKEMRDLLNRVDKNLPLDFSKFPEVSNIISLAPAKSTPGSTSSGGTGLAQGETLQELF